MLAVERVGNSAYQNVQGVYSHIIDPNERRRLALAEVDKAPLGWYHARLIIVTGVGFFTDAYSLFAINVTTVMIGMVFWHESNHGVIPHDADTAIKVATSGGTVLGQIVFGYLADYLGRKKMYGIELLIIISATLAQSLCAPSKSISFVGVLVFWRVLMGIGIGGDYPLSAVITSELASTKWRGLMVAAVFAMQGLGQFAAALMALIVTQVYRKHLETVSSVAQCTGDCLTSVDMMWRIILGFGGIPGWFALYYRLTIPETPRYTFDVLQDVEKAVNDSQRYRNGKRGEASLDPLGHARMRAEMQKYGKPKPSVKEAVLYFYNRKNATKLIGTAGSWFFLDIAFYGLGLNSGSVLAAIGYSAKGNVYDTLHNTAVGQLILVCAGAVPGYWVTVATIDTFGRKPIQIMGFTVLTILFAVIGFLFNSLSQNNLLVLYVLCQFFFNFGPNATTFISPAEIFPTRVRATAHGISAASGKIGAIVAQVVFAPMVKKGSTPTNPNPWLDSVMQIFSLFMFCGLLTTLLVPESKRATLEDLSGEGQDQNIYELAFRERFWSGGNPDPGHKISSGKFMWGRWVQRYLRLK